ncbi:hypothetical protein SAMN02745136_04678 [Anaerocolumna jejuensis DSM 15929]|uniref:Uncharacterized protein n=1 Tax=Anaerocolumna jejuensis DSM 15929 TaxID=1121322 RepID=A0A1M6ZV70_9FIRM|nr:hypothetical protein SAMN02745136_04678 [Anaerocolumna jejuensis DSM 15929]
MGSFVFRSVNRIIVMEGMLFDLQKRSRCIAGPTVKGSTAIC